MDGGWEVDFAQFIEGAVGLHLAACDNHFFFQDWNPFDVGSHFDAPKGDILGQLLELCQLLCVEEGGVGQKAFPPEGCSLLRRKYHFFLHQTWVTEL